MKNKRRWLILEAVLAVLVILVAFAMLREKSGKEQDKISVIVENSDDYQWSAFKYGLEMAARDEGVEAFVVNVSGALTVKEQEKLIRQEIENRAEGIILQPLPGEESRKMIKKWQKKLPLLCVEGTEEAKEKLSAVQPDHYGMGRTLGEEILKDYNGSLENKTLGFFARRRDSAVTRERIEGFRDAVKDSGAQIRWFLTASEEKNVDKALELKSQVDMVICLDDYSFTKAGEVASVKNLHGALIYGIGHSTETMYYVDTGLAECAVVPDEFQVGYQSLCEISRKMQNSYYPMKNHQVSHTVIRRENLFSKENQELLFTMSQ